MFATLHRNYKDASAVDTINKIKNILSEIDLMPKEVDTGNMYPQIHSFRIQLSEEKGSFGTNGKGRNKNFALASGYAEFLERIQNGLYATMSRTMLGELRKKFGFFYTPDEKYLTEKDILELPQEILNDFIRYSGKNKIDYIKAYCNCIKSNKLPGVVSIPFYNTQHKKLSYLPLNMLKLAIGSNGMAAGNTIFEAIFQGICELMERWGAAEIYYNQLTPPTVLRSYLKKYDEEYGIIENIEKSGTYRVIVKDFSANKRIPTLGLIIINQKLNKYKLNVGSDTSFQVALSRCLTEIHQGFRNEELFDSKLLDIPKKEAKYFISNDESSVYERYIEFSNFTKDNSGVFPCALFKTKPSYDFDPGVFTSRKDYETEVKDLITYFYKNGYNVYIRDVSYLGFPSVLIYIPEVSAMGRKSATISTNTKEFSNTELDKIQKAFFNFSDLTTKNEMKKMIEVFSKLNGSMKLSSIFNIDFKYGSPWKGITIDFFLTQLYYRLGNNEKAYQTFSNFLKTRKEKPEYYLVIEEYLKLLSKNYDKTLIHGELEKKNYNKDVIKKVCSDLKNPKNIFKYTNFPRCPDCSNCNLNNECLTRSQIDVSSLLYAKNKEHLINQEYIGSIF